MMVERLLYKWAMQVTPRGTIQTDGTDIGTSDQTVNAIYTAANGDGTTGAATVTILYIQNNNLS